MTKADQAFKKGDFDAALKAYQWYRSDAKLGVVARIQSGHCLLKLGNPLGAAREWKSVRDSWPNAPEVATALTLEIQTIKDAAERKKLEDILLAKYADSKEAKALQALREKSESIPKSPNKLTPESELDQLLEAGKREEAEKFLVSAARKATGEERDIFLAQLATLYESTGDWRKATGTWQKIAEEGNAKYRESATFDWIRTTTAIGKNSELVESMWVKFLRDHPTSPRGHLAVTQLAEMMVARGSNDRAAALLSDWLATAEEKSPSAVFVSKRLADLQKQAEDSKGGAPSSFGKERLEAIAKLPAELEALCDQARTCKNTDKTISRIREIRRELLSTDTVLMLHLDRAEALALNGQRDQRRSLSLLDNSWSRISKVIVESKEPAMTKAASELTRDAIGIAMESRNFQSVVAWAERTALAAFPVAEAEVDFLNETAIRLVLANAKTQGIEVLSIIEKQLLARLSEDSQLRVEKTAVIARLKALCTNGTAVADNEWFVSEIPTGVGSVVAKALFEADLLFAARETEQASSAYSNVIRGAGISKDTEGYATLQLARCLVALGDYEEALRIYRRFEDSLSATKSAAPALLRAGTLCAGSLNDPRRAKDFFSKVSVLYPASPEAELCDWYIAHLLMWEGNRNASRTAFDDFERKYPQSAFIPTLNKSIRPML